MAKKTRGVPADAHRLVRRLQAVHDQLREQAARAGRAADTIARLQRELESQLASSEHGAPGEGNGRPGPPTRRVPVSHRGAR
jgi:hypothetical protein